MSGYNNKSKNDNINQSKQHQSPFYPTSSSTPLHLPASHQPPNNVQFNNNPLSTPSYTNQQHQHDNDNIIDRQLPMLRINTDENYNPQHLQQQSRQGRLSNNNQLVPVSTSIIPTDPTMMKLSQQRSSHMLPQDHYNDTPGSSSMQLLHEQLTIDSNLKHQLLDLEELYSRLKQQITNKQDQIKQAEDENNDYEKKIIAMNEKVKELTLIQNEWKDKNESILKKRLEGLRRDNGNVEKRKEDEIITLNQNINKEEQLHDLYLNWINSILPQRVKQSSSMLLDQIANLELTLKDLKEKNNNVMKIVSHTSLLNDSDNNNNNDDENNKQFQQNDFSLVGQKQYLARLKKQVDDLKHELLPWSESLTNIQERISILHHYPLTLANAVLASKVPSNLRNQYKQQQQQQQQLQQSTTVIPTSPNMNDSLINPNAPTQQQSNIFAAFDLTKHLSTFPFSTDMQLFNLSLTSQSPIGQLTQPSIHDINVNMKLFDFKRFISTHLDQTTNNINHHDVDKTANNNQDEISSIVLPSTMLEHDPKINQMLQAQQSLLLMHHPSNPIPLVNQHEIWSNPLFLWKYDLSPYLFPTYQNCTMLLELMDQVNLDFDANEHNTDNYNAIHTNDDNYQFVDDENEQMNSHIHDNNDNRIEQHILSPNQRDEDHLEVNNINFHQHNQDIVHDNDIENNEMIEQNIENSMDVNEQYSDPIPSHFSPPPHQQYHHQHQNQSYQHRFQ